MSKLIQFLVQDSADQKIYDLSEVVVDISYSTELNSVGKLTFSYLKQVGRMFIPGSIVKFVYEGQGVFYGYIFETHNTNKNEISVTAFDQLRYFKNKDSMLMQNFTTGKLVKSICRRFNLKPGNIADTGYILPDQVIRNKTLLDVVLDTIKDTLVATGKHYHIQDDFGSVGLYELMDLRLPLILGDNLQTFSYDYGRSIDQNTYNKIKLAQKQGQVLNQTFIEEDTNNQKKWGILQFYDEVDENLTPLQIKEQAKLLLKLYNHETRSLSIECIGDKRVRAGSGIKVILSNLMIDQYFIVRSASHKFSKKGVHTMSLELMMV